MVAAPKLWPETIASIKAYLKKRPAASIPETERLLFRTTKGLSYVHVKKPTSERLGGKCGGESKAGVSVLFAAVAERCGVKCRGFIRSAEPIAPSRPSARSNKQVIDLTMGHSADYDDMAAVTRSTFWTTCWKRFLRPIARARWKAQSRSASWSIFCKERAGGRAAAAFNVRSGSHRRTGGLNWRRPARKRPRSHG